MHIEKEHSEIVVIGNHALFKLSEVNMFLMQNGYVEAATWLLLSLNTGKTPRGRSPNAPKRPKDTIPSKKRKHIPRPEAPQVSNKRSRSDVQCTAVAPAIATANDWTVFNFRCPSYLP
jgi:hypothetical protein